MSNAHSLARAHTPHTTISALTFGPGVSYPMVLGVGYKKANVAKFDPDTNQVTLSDGTVMSYDYLVVATGLENRWPVPGAGNAEALANNVCSIYGGAAHAARTFIMITGVKPGDSVRPSRSSIDLPVQLLIPLWRSLSRARGLSLTAHLHSATNANQMRWCATKDHVPCG